MSNTTNNSIVDDFLVWVDIETTGLEPTKDCILEVGIVITDMKLVEVNSASWLIAPTVDINKRMDDYVRDMHQKNGLLEAIENGDGMDPWLAQSEIVEFIGAIKGPMCGSSVHFDRTFIQRHMPEVITCFNHRNLDVSSVMMSNRMAGHKVVNPSRGNHRAVGDLRDSIDVLRVCQAQLIPAEVMV